MTSRRARWALLGFLFLGAPASAQDVITISGVVTTRPDGEPVAGAVVSVSDADATATTNGDGQYTLTLARATVPGARVQLRVDALGLPTHTIDVVVDGATLTANVELTLGFTEQVIVGSRASAAESGKAVPVDIITREQIARSGYDVTAQVIQSLTPSFNFPRPTITDGTDTVRPATLRGLGPDQVLVLINGKRRHQSALVHLNNSIGRGSDAPGSTTSSTSATRSKRLPSRRRGSSSRGWTSSSGRFPPRRGRTSPTWPPTAARASSMRTPIRA